MNDIIRRLGEFIKEHQRTAGDYINAGGEMASNIASKYASDFGTITQPGALAQIPGFVGENVMNRLSDIKNAKLPSDYTTDDWTNFAMDYSNPIGGALGPIARASADTMGKGLAKKINKDQKKVLKSLFRTDPKSLEEAVASPQIFDVGIPGTDVTGIPKKQIEIRGKARMGDAFAHFSPDYMPSGLTPGKPFAMENVGGTVRVGPNVMRGLDPHTKMLREAPDGSYTAQRNPILRKQGVEDLGDIVTHEFTHGFNEKMIGTPIPTDPNQTMPRWSLASLLSNPTFTGHTKYGPAIVNQHLSALDHNRALNEGLSYLSQPTGRSAPATWLHNVIAGRGNPAGLEQFDERTQKLLTMTLKQAQQVPDLIRQAPQVSRSTIPPMFNPGPSNLNVRSDKLMRLAELNKPGGAERLARNEALRAKFQAQLDARPPARYMAPKVLPEHLWPQRTPPPALSPEGMKRAEEINNRFLGTGSKPSGSLMGDVMESARPKMTPLKPGTLKTPITGEMPEGLGTGLGVIPDVRNQATKNVWGTVEGTAGMMPRGGAPTKDYATRLREAFRFYNSNPDALSGAKKQLQPALRHGPGDPAYGQNMITTKDSHSALYEHLRQNQPFNKAQQEHGYYDPIHDVFLGDALNSMLYDPAQVKEAAELLASGTLPKDLLKAMGFDVPKEAYIGADADWSRFLK